MAIACSPIEAKSPISISDDNTENIFIDEY